MTNKSYYDDLIVAEELLHSSEAISNTDEKIMEHRERLKEHMEVYKACMSNSEYQAECLRDNLLNLTTAYLVLESSMASHSKQYKNICVLRSKVANVYSKIMDQETSILKSSVLVDQDIIPHGCVSDMLNIHRDSKTIGFSLSTDESVVLKMFEDFIAVM